MEAWAQVGGTFKAVSGLSSAVASSHSSRVEAQAVDKSVISSSVQTCQAYGRGQAYQDYVKGDYVRSSGVCSGNPAHRSEVSMSCSTPRKKPGWTEITKVPSTFGWSHFQVSWLGLFLGVPWYKRWCLLTSGSYPSPPAPGPPASLEHAWRDPLKLW